MANLGARSVWVVGALVLCVGLTGCGGDNESPDGVVPGHVADNVDGTQARIIVPTGALDLTVGAPLDGDLAADLAADGEKQAAGDGAFVPVTWSFDPSADIPGRAIVAQDPQPLRMTLVAAGADVELPSPYTVEGDALGDLATAVFYVPVDDPEADLEIQATYDDLTQTWDAATGDLDSGAAAPLYDEPTGATALPCPDRTITRGGYSADVRCAMSVERVPYLPGSGWAPDGRTFAVVGHRITADAPSGPSDDAEVSDARATVRVDGAAPVGEVPTLGTVAADDTARGLEAFDAPDSGGRASVRADFALSGAGGVGPLRFRTTVRLR